MKWCIQVAAILLTGVAYPSATSQQRPSLLPIANHAGHAPASSLDFKGVPNFHEVTPRLYRGARPTPAGVQGLAKMGIGILVDGGGLDKRERDQAHRLGMQYVSIPWHCPFPKDTVFARFLVVMRKNPEKKIFVHCRLGDDRTGMMIASYRMAEQGWTAARAMDEMKRDGFTAPHHLLCPGLARYEKEFPHRYKTNPIFHAAR